MPTSTDPLDPTARHAGASCRRAGLLAALACWTLSAAAAQELKVSVIDAGTGEPVKAARIVLPDKWMLPTEAWFFDPKPSIPAVGPFDGEGRVPLDDTRQIWVGAPGYAWTEREVDPAVERARTVKLERACAWTLFIDNRPTEVPLTVSLERLILNDAGRFELGPLVRVPLVENPHSLSGLPEGRYVATLRLGDRIAGSRILDAKPLLLKHGVATHTALDASKAPPATPESLKSLVERVALRFRLADGNSLRYWLEVQAGRSGRDDVRVEIRVAGKIGFPFRSIIEFLLAIEKSGRGVCVESADFGTQDADVPEIGIWRPREFVVAQRIEGDPRPAPGTIARAEAMWVVAKELLASPGGVHFERLSVNAGEALLAIWVKEHEALDHSLATLRGKDFVREVAAGAVSDSRGGFLCEGVRVVFR